MASINPVQLKKHSRYDSHDGWACRTNRGTILWFTACSTKEEAAAHKRRLDNHRRRTKLNLFGELELVRVKIKLEAVEGPSWRRSR